MFEVIVLIIFFIVGGLTALLALFFFVVAFVKQSKTMFKIGLAFCIIPLSLYGLTYWFYDNHIPSLNKQTEERYAGTYIMTNNDNDTTEYINVKLTLNNNNTFHLDKNNFTNFVGSGKWKTGATDEGQFEFKDNSNVIIFWASPYNENKLVVDENFNDRRSVTFIRE
jgi:hypothetical protein